MNIQPVVTRMLLTSDSGKVFTNKAKGIRVIDPEKLIKVYLLKPYEEKVISGFVGFLPRKVRFDDSPQHLFIQTQKSWRLPGSLLSQLEPVTPWRLEVKDKNEMVDGKGVYNGDDENFINDMSGLMAKNSAVAVYGQSESDVKCVRAGMGETCGAGSDEHYSNSALYPFIYSLSMLMEEKFYRVKMSNAERISGLQAMRRQVCSLVPIESPFKKILDDFLDNAIQLEHALFHLSCQIANETFIVKHHDELCGLFVDGENYGLHRHFADFYPYHSIKMVNALTYVLTEDIGAGLCLSHLEGVSIKLGNGKEWSDKSYQTILVKPGQYSISALEEMINESVIICKERKSREKAIQFVRSCTREASALIVDAPNAKCLLDSSGYQQTLKVDSVDPEALDLMCQLTAMEKKDVLIEGIEQFNRAVYQLKHRDKHRELEPQFREEGLRKAVIQLIRVTLLMHPFTSGNVHMASLLDILLCRIAGIRYIKLDVMKYLLFTHEEVLALQKDLCGHFNQARSQLDSLNPVISLIELNAVRELDVVLDSVAHFVDKTHRGWTPLMFACSLGLADVVRTLLRHGADVNLLSGIPNRPDKEKMTPFKAALKYGFSDEVIAALLGSGDSQ